MFLCDGSSKLKIKLAPDAKVKAFLKKTVFAFVRSKGVGSISKVNISVTYSGFKRGGGQSQTQTFGALFGNNDSNFPSFAPKIIRASGNIRVLASNLLIKRSPTNLPTQIFNINSPSIISGGWDAIPSSVYEPLNSNNSTLVISKGPLVIHNAKLKRLSTSFELRASINRPINNFRARISGTAVVKSKLFEKLHGHFEKINKFDNFIATEKLYPIQDIVTSYNNIHLVNEKVKKDNLFQSIDEGVFTGNITKNNKVGNLISDDDASFITPSSIYTKGTFKYKFEVNSPNITPLESFLFLRAAAPIFNYETDQSTLYDITNIKFEDPSGNLIIKYKDLQVRGEANFEDKNQYHYITYVTEPEINNAALNTWKQKYPILGEASGYTVSLDITGDCFYKPFATEFNKGFEFEANLNDKFVNTSENDYLAVDGAPLSTQSQDYHIRPTNAIRISAIEMANLGRGIGLIRDSELPFYLSVQPTGTWLERTIYPTQVLLSTFDNNIFPTGLTNIWETSPDIDGIKYQNTSNDDKSQFELKDRLSNLYIAGHIVSHTSPSGKLQLLYEHQRPFSVKVPRGGPFQFGNKYTNPFNRADVEIVYADDSFFVIQDIYLQVVAKKASGTNDFPIDVVGYSNDKVLFITSDVGGFLQNADVGSGNMPLVSGFGPVYDLAISTESISDKQSYFSKNITDKEAGDHYLITQSPLVDSTSFKEYNIPLKIYKDKVALGMPIDYAMSTYFESLYLDIYPIPSGASIATANLIVKYKPAGAIPLSTVGFIDKEIARRRNRLYPSSRKMIDKPINSNVNTELSLIENVPHGYDTAEPTLKTNYARRWRGCSGNVFGGPFDPVPFDFAFSNPQLDQPFTIGYYDFNNTINNSILSSIYEAPSSYSGIFIGNLDNSLTRNLGLRFNSTSLFSNPARNYTSLDWTDSNHELHGKIFDAFDNVVRVSGQHGYIDFNNIPTSSGFALYVRFTPDYNMSGVGYNLWNSGVILSKWDNGQNLEYALGYKDGYLSAYARDNSGTIVELQDSVKYDQYQYPLSILLTYNDNQSQKLRLFANNEIASGQFNILRDESSPFILTSGNSKLLYGYSEGSGVGINAFISEIGISTHNEFGGGNLVYGIEPNSSYQQDNVELFFDSHGAKFWHTNESNVNDKYKLWQFVDEKTNDWKLGAFKYCSFGVAYDTMSFRNGKDFVYHIYYNDGQTYADRTDISLPASINLTDIAYHTQIENDMLRLNLSGNEDRLYSLPPRLVKNLPRGYLVAEDSLIVNSVVQHECDYPITWPNGKTGAKLIVSLYTPSKESVLFPTKNFGLISRSSHYLNPKDCWNKIQSKFTLGDLKDNESEPWAFFDKTITHKEFEENYFVKDIDQMFVQYDVVYPSGLYTRSKIKLHSVDVELNGINQSDTALANLPIYSSGKAYQEASMPLYELAYVSAFDESMDIYVSGVTYIEQSGIMALISSGIFNENVSMPLYTIQVGSASTSNNNFGDLFGNSIPLPLGMTLFVEGGYDNAEDDIACYIEGFTDNVISNSLNLFSYYDVNKPAIGELNFMLLATFAASTYDISSSSTLGLYALGPQRTWQPVNSVLPFYTNSRPQEENINANFPLYLYHVKPVSKRDNELEAFKWDGTSFGTEISVLDNQFASIPADDEIRGVQTICYGNCDTNSNIKCQEDQLITHDTLWYDPECVNGGVVRPITVYTNPDVGAFGTDIPYSGHFYGIRKFGNLIPQAPYTITITGRTGTDKILQVPREMTEWEYGNNEDVGYSGIKLTATVNSSGNHFGKSVTVLNDRIMIGCPYENILDEENYEVKDAGKIYIYRKDPEPSGYDWRNQLDKSNFTLEQELVLPTGWRRDYFYKTNVIFRDRFGQPLPYIGVGTNWIVSQEGRQLGYSLDSARRNNTDVLVAGGPGAKWSRTFPSIQQTPVTIGLFVFNNELVSDPPGKNWQQILAALSDRDLAYRYFCDPAVKFDIKVILCEPMLGSNIDIGETSIDFAAPQPPFVSKYITHRHFNYNVNTTDYQERENIILQELKDIFHEVFPLTQGSLHSGIPPLLGFYIDDSRSLGSKALGYNIPFRKGALDKFIDYYKEYSINNGLQDFDGDPAEGFVNVTVDTDEDWISQSINCLLDITDIETLQENNVQKLIANNLGSFNENVADFNYPPPSGGSVYIFERKENDVFRVVQEIKSPVTYTNDVSDRFGHDVAISDDGKVIVIGSPYSPHSLQVFEYNEQFDTVVENFVRIGYFFIRAFLQPRYYQEIENATFGESYELYKEYEERLPTTNSISDLNFEIYNSMSDGLRFAYFKFLENSPLPVKRYNLIYQMGVYFQGDSFAPLWERYIPTPRLGYSVDVNSDGSLIAIGAPTDSLGERDYSQTWFRYDIRSGQSTMFGGEPWQWQNYTNAGAVRLLESRNYYPHNRKVVEYYKFGNLHELLSPPQDSGLFTFTMNNLYNSMGYNFSRTSFAEDLEIPQDAGLAFIITPAIDAASDEIINNIKEWLSLGDRHLVLVGNDPKWEANGAYFNSNRIINYILEKLDVNMRIYAARNQYEALMTNTNTFYNVQNSFVPAKSTPSIAYPVPLRGSGVGDIRLYDPDILDLYMCDKPPTGSSDPFTFDFERKKTYRELHDKCEMPIVHEGDLRAKYIDQCEIVTPRGFAWISYEKNLGFQYGTHNIVDWGCGGDTRGIHPNLNTNSEPVPILSAYEAIPKTIIVPGAPPQEVLSRKLVGYDSSTSTRTTFGTSAYSGVAFIWSHDDSNYSDLNYNINNTLSKSLFFDPDEYNGNNALLQAKSTISNQDATRLINAKPNACMVSSEKYNATSKVVLIATTMYESRNILLSSAGDRNINLYFNLIATNADGNAKVAQVGGFTNRSSYTAGYSKSDVQTQLTNVGIDMSSLNVATKDLYDISNNYTAAWIANTDQMPSEEDIQNIKRFLDMGNKTLIITYGQEPSLGDESSSSGGMDAMGMYTSSAYNIRSANVAKYLCEQLNLSMQPLFLEGKNKYANRSDIQTDNIGRLTSSLVVTEGTYLYEGFDDKSSFNTGMGGFGSYEGYVSVPYSEEPPFPVPNGFTHEFIPINTNNGLNLAHFSAPITDTESFEIGVPKFNTGIAKVSFPVPEKSEEHDDYNLFRLHFKILQESSLEISPIAVVIANCYADIHPNVEVINQPTGPLGNNLKLIDVDENNNIKETYVRAGLSSQLYSDLTVYLQIPSGQETLDIYFGHSQTYQLQQNPKQLRTVRLLSVSGVRIPSQTITTLDRWPVYDTEIVTIPGTPDTSYVQLFNREISTDSSKYCTSNNRICSSGKPVGYGTPGEDIADGPVVMAQAVYHQGGYFNGYNKSRITVISDPSLIQGRSILTENGNSINPNLPWFLASLYPLTTFKSNNSGRQYETAFKIISPERSSPSRLINAYPENSGLNYRFGKFASNNLPATKYSDLEGKLEIAGKKPPQPTDPMLPLLTSDIWNFRIELSPPPIRTEEEKAALRKEWYIDNFNTVQEYYASTSKIRDTYNGVTYEDAGIFNRIPPILRATGKDHLDLDVFYSGYPGDLFGYSVKIHKDKLYVGAPFSPYNTEEITPWTTILSSGMQYGKEVGFNGGAGAVYLIEKVGNVGSGLGSVNFSNARTNGIPWAVTQKFRPEEISVGFSGLNTSTSQTVLGANTYTNEELSNLAFVSDMFGYDIALNGDILAISAPCHNFENYSEDTEAPFIRKEFNEQFDIQRRIIHDLAITSEREQYGASGTVVLNHGAVFTYENKINNWGSKAQEWTKVQKLVSQGINARVQNSGENTFFGNALAIDRARRVDGDYILAIGAMNHAFADNDDTFISGAGSTYAYDGMLRSLRPAFSHPDTFISGRVYGEYQRPTDYTTFTFKNNNNFDYKELFNGVVLSNINGEIFIEVSGQDRLPRGYVVHRPYIEHIRGSFLHGTPTFDNIRLFTDGAPPFASGSLPMINFGPESNNVYNTVDLYTLSLLQSSGIVPLYASGLTPSSGVLELYCSGIVNMDANLILRTRGSF